MIPGKSIVSDFVRRSLGLSAALLALGLAHGAPAWAADYQVIHNFAGPATDGTTPYGSLIQSGSTLYGMTSLGGSGGGWGTVFQVGTDGTGFSLLHSFTNGSDGRYPAGSLIQSGSTLYGMANYGGGAFKSGTIFQVGTDGSGFGVLHTFGGGSSDGSLGPLATSIPRESLIQSGDTLYGMTHNGGSSAKGTIFQIGTDGTGFGLLHSFTGGSDGSHPQGSLIQSGSTFYGVTSWFGGTVFKMETDGTGFSVLHTFAAFPGDAAGPSGSLIQSGSTLYGTTAWGGTYDGGAIFKVETDGSGYSLLHSFPLTDGPVYETNPQGSLIVSGSTLYGTTLGGGISGYGSVFQIETDGSDFEEIHSFAGGSGDGKFPFDSLIQSDSILYGMTSLGGSFGGGVIFSIDLAPVPEPSTLLLGVLGTLALAGYGACRRYSARRSVCAPGRSAIQL